MTVLNRNEPRLLPTNNLRNDLTVSVRNRSTTPAMHASSSLPLAPITIVRPGSSSSSTPATAVERTYVSDLDPTIQMHISRIKDTREERTRQARERADSGGVVAPECNVSSSLVRQIASESTKKLCDRFVSN